MAITVLTSKNRLALYIPPSELYCLYPFNTFEDG